VQTRYLLPKDLAGALKRLDDTEVDSLLVAVTREAQRRGRLPRASASKALAREDAGSSLTTGKLNAVRAAFKAGVKPSAIARQFGMSLSEVKKALATEARDLALIASQINQQTRFQSFALCCSPLEGIADESAEAAHVAEVPEATAPLRSRGLSLLCWAPWRAGCSSISQCPNSPVTSVATKRRSSAWAVPNDYSAPTASTGIVSLPFAAHALLSLRTTASQDT
jgi:hypothetical protein